MSYESDYVQMDKLCENNNFSYKNTNRTIPTFTRTGLLEPRIYRTSKTSSVNTRENYKYNIDWVCEYCKEQDNGKCNEDCKKCDCYDKVNSCMEKKNKTYTRSINGNLNRFEDIEECWAGSRT